MIAAAFITLIREDDVEIEDGAMLLQHYLDRQFAYSCNTASRRTTKMICSLVADGLEPEI